MSFKKIIATADTYISSAGPSNGAISPFTVGAGSGTPVGLLKFDLSSIPSNATITAATVYLTSTAAGASETQNVHRLVRDWVETEANWSLAQTGISWGTAGASNTTTDYNNTLLDSFTYPTAADTVVSVSIASTVQDWLDGTSDNDGLRISASAGSNRSWHSREATTAAFFPYLEVFFTIPAITYEVNSNAINAGIQADWKPIPTGGNADATQKLSTNWRQHTWLCAFMEMAEWLILLALRGTSFTELKTTNEATPNLTATYAIGRVMTVTGRQIGRRMVGVQVGYLVDITS